MHFFSYDLSFSLAILAYLSSFTGCVLVVCPEYKEYWSVQHLDNFINFIVFSRHVCICCRGMSIKPAHAEAPYSTVGQHAVLPELRGVIYHPQGCIYILIALTFGSTYELRNMFHIAILQWRSGLRR
jgi:hypothetical protein